MTLELADGSTQTSEIAAGSGYYSESSPACFFGYPQASPPRRLRIRWPSGASSTQDLPRAPAGPTLTIAMPRP